VNQLSRYMDINYYQNDDNTMTVTTGKGYPLVSHGDSYTLGFDGNNVTWQSSDGKALDITSSITGGQMGGWIDMRDNVIPEYQGKLDTLANSIISAVNEVHSQGVGLGGMTDVTGSYKATAPGSALDSSGLPYQDQVTSGSFSFWAYDASGQPVDLGGTNGSLQVSVDPASTTMNDIQSALNGVAGGNITASVTTDGRLEIQGQNGYSFAFSGDTSNVLTALGINTFFTGTDAKSMAVNPELENDTDLIAAGKVDPSTGQIASGDNSNALDMANLQYQTVPAVGDTLDNYLANMEGSVGIDSQSVTRSNTFNQTLVTNLQQQRDNVSAVSIDEEMTNVIKYQQAYAAAAKLISVADQMYQTLLDAKQ
jgi:flagellar hook-associated protein 1